MERFKHRRRYQLGMFLAPVTRKPVDVDEIAKMVAARVPDAPELAVRLRNRKTERQLQVPLVDAEEGTGQVVETISWSGPALWQLVFSQQRLDLSVDALGYAEISDRELPLVDVCKRIVPNYVRLVEELGLVANRLLCVVDLADRDDAYGSPAEFVKRRYLGKHWRDEASIDDVTVRVNVPATETIGGDRIAVNRLETGSALRLSKGGQVETRLELKFDYNTLHRAESAYSGAEIVDFFTCAVRWIESTVNGLETVDD